MLSAVTAVLVLFLSSLAVRSYNMHRYHVEKQTRFMMDTFVTLYAVGPESVAAAAVKAAFERMQEVSERFNHLDPKGPIYAFNIAGTPITDPEIVYVAQTALDIAEKSGGAFDITIEPLIDLWGFYGDNPALPPEPAIKECLKKTGYRRLHVENGILSKDDPSIRIDLGGIAKGYAVNEAKNVLLSKGVASALIDAGGDVFALGRRGKELWKIGIRSPRGDEILGFMDVADMAVMGSGDYERYFMKDGTRYHHIMDPVTGYPAKGLMGTTLLLADPMLADAWNTAIFVLGPDKGRALVETIPGMEAVMVTEKGDILVTSGLAHAMNIHSLNP